MEYWAFVGQIVSALAVVLSLVFVGIQLYESNRVAARSEANDTQAQWASFRASIYGSRDIAEMFRAGMDGSRPLDPADKLRFDYLMREHGWATYQVWQRVQEGLMPRAHYEQGQGLDFVRVICTPGGAAVWARIKAELPRPYAADTDRLAADYARAGKLRCGSQADRVEPAHPAAVLQQRVDCLRHLDIAGGEAAGVVRGQQDVDLVPHVRPFGMMVCLLGEQRHAGHEAEGLVEVLEREMPGDRVTRRIPLPIGQRRERFRAKSIRQTRHHHCLPCRSSIVRPIPPGMTGQAPDAAAIERLARAALARIPEPFQAHLADIVLVIEDFADDETLDAMGIEDPFDLTGLYRGRPVGEKSAWDGVTMPDEIHLYRRPLLDEWVHTGVTLEALITHVVVHEVGHHFGLSDDDMHALEDSAE